MKIIVDTSVIFYSSNGWLRKRFVCIKSNDFLYCSEEVKDVVV